MPHLVPEAQMERRRLLFRPCKTRAELHDWCYVFLSAGRLNVDLPGTIVDPDSNTTPLDMLWSMYSRLMYPGGDEADVAEMLFYANREGGKTLVVSIMEVLALLHVKTDVVHLAAQLDQSHVAQRYLKKFFTDCEDLRGLLVGDNVQETLITYYVSMEDPGVILYPREHKALSLEEQSRYRRFIQRTEITAATMRGTNSKHAGFLVLDEVDIIQDPRIIGEAKNIPSPIRRDDGTYADPLTVYTSTRKTAFGAVQRAIDEADKTGLLVRHFNVLEVTQRCPASRHRPDLPRLPVFRSDELQRTVDPATHGSYDPKTQSRFVRDEAYTGCMTNCSIFAACKGNLATKPELDNEFLKPLSYVVKKIKGQTIDYVRSQLLCHKPSSVGLIYGHLIGPQHVLSPAQAYERVLGRPAPQGRRMTKVELLDALHETDTKHYGGQDYGHTHAFAFPVGFRFGRSFYVVRCPAASDLDPGEKLQLAEPLRMYAPEAVWGDTEDPGMIAYFRKHGWRMRDWVKAKGSVVTGIDIVKDMLMPQSGDPEMFFVVEEDGDEEMLYALTKLREHAWKLDAAGRPTNVPSDLDKDIPDAVRYVVMNLFPHRRGGIISADAVQLPVAEQNQPTAQQAATRPDPVMQDIVRGLIGGGPAGGSAGVVGKSGRLRFLG